MIRPRLILPRMRAMNYMELLFAALAAGASASMVYVGSAAASRDDLATLNIDMAIMTGAFTFVSMLVAQHPEWVV